MCHTFEKSFLLYFKANIAKMIKAFFSGKNYIKSTVKYGSGATLLVILQQIFSNDIKSNDSTVICMSQYIFIDLRISFTTCMFLAMNKQQMIVRKMNNRASFSVFRLTLTTLFGFLDFHRI